MTLKFTLNQSMATDPQLGIDIYDPRIEPGRNASESDYQYRVVIRGKSDGIALWSICHSGKSGLLSYWFERAWQFLSALCVIPKDALCSLS